MIFVTTHVKLITRRGNLKGPEGAKQGGEQILKADGWALHELSACSRALRNEYEGDGRTDLKAVESNGMLP
jgi:hypothetical protein